MDRLTHFFRVLYLTPRLFIILGGIIGLFLASYLLPQIFLMAQVALFLLILFVILDIVLIFSAKEGIKARRNVPDKFSNGDENPIDIICTSDYRFGIKISILDEVPFEFQWREKTFEHLLPSSSTHTFPYQLRPVERGLYEFGKLNIYAWGPLELVRRRYIFNEGDEVPCYPSFIQMRKYQLMAISHRLTDVGVKQIRRLGHTTEFEQIKEYISGDDYRTINWKATARSGKLMVNQYIDERAQIIYCIIDKSRVMKMPFEGLTLLDYAINASLVITGISTYRHDKAGLITFAEKIYDIVPADSRSIQVNRIMEVLYNQETDFLEGDYGKLYILIKRKVSQRSLLMLFTNFESLDALHRQLPYLQRLAKMHLLVVIFFENTELQELLEATPTTMEEAYIKTTAEDMAFTKRQITRELQRHGILTILTPPKELTVNALNQYLEIKSRGQI